VSLIGVELVEEFVDTVIMTGRLKPPHSPTSVILIGAPETGKTSIVSNKKAKSIAVFSDVTGRGLVEACKLNAEISHFVLNDLVAIMSHKPTVNRYTQSMLNALTEEGIQSLAVPGNIEAVANGRRGVIACITMDLAKDGRSWWNKIGFASRLLPFSFSHSGTLTLRIKAMIDKGERPRQPDILYVPGAPAEVSFASKYVRRVRAMSDQKAKELKDPTGYRRLKQFRALACGHALLRNGIKEHRPQVNEIDMDFLKRIFPFVSYDKLEPI
jgi:hypothetical protein